MSQDINLANNDDERINPATEDLQRDIKTELIKLKSATNDIKFQKVTISSAGAIEQPASYSCKTVKFWTAATTVSVGDADSQPYLLAQNIERDLPINNVGNLRFTGSAGGEVVYIVSSN